MTGRPVAFVGAGPGAADLITRRGRDMLRAAEVVVSDRRSLDGIVDRYAPVSVERLLVGRSGHGPAWELGAVVDLLAARHDAGRRVVRLKSGDLFVCSRAAEEVALLRARGVAVDLVPGVSAAVAAPLAAGTALVPAGGGTVTVVAGNEDPVYPPIDWAHVAASGSAVVVLMGRAHQGLIAAGLIAGGRSAGTEVHLVHGATRAGERVVTTTLGELGRVRVPAPATVIVPAADGSREA